MNKPETCRDVLAELGSMVKMFRSLGGDLSQFGFTPNRIRAAIAADDAERARLRGIERAAIEMALVRFNGNAWQSWRGGAEQWHRYLDARRALLVLLPEVRDDG